MPDKLTKARDGIDYRKHQRCEVDLSPWNGNEWRHRLMRRTQAAAEAALSLANYRRSRSSWAGGDHETSVLVYRRTTPNIEGRAVKAWSRNGRWSGNTSKITATVRASWVVRVAKIGGGSGLVADKNGDSLFVLDVLREHDMVFVRNGRSLRKPGQVVALVGRQGRGFDVTARPALVDAATGVIVRWETKAAQIEPIAEAA
jgi:hypothetical protein